MLPHETDETDPGRIRRERLLDRRLARLGLAPNWLWASVHLDEDTWQLIDVDHDDGGVHVLCVSSTTGDAVLTTLTDTPDELKEAHVALVRAALEELTVLRTGSRFRRWSGMAQPVESALVLLFDPTFEESAPNRLAQEEHLAIGITKQNGWIQFRVALTVDEALSTWGELRAAIAEVMVREFWPRHLAQRQAVLARWLQSGARIRAQRTVSDPALRGPIDLTDITPHREALERAVLNAAVVDSGVFNLAGEDRERGLVITGAAARTLTETLLVPALHASIDCVLDELDQRDVLTNMLTVLQAQLGAHLDRHNTLAVHRAGPWAGAHVSAHLASAASQHAARVTEMVVEMTVRRPRQTGRPLDRIDRAILDACASVALSAALGRQADTAHISRLQVTLERGSIRVAQEPTGVIDLDAYRQLLDVLLATAIEPVPSATEIAAGERPFSQLGIDKHDPADRRTYELNATLRDLTGAGMSELVAVLATASSLPTGTDGIVRTSRNGLVDDAATWAKLDPDSVGAACDVLTLCPNVMAGAAYEFWKLEARQVRLATRPFLSVDDTLWFSPARVRGTQRLFANYFGDGRLPWPVDPMPFNPNPCRSRDDASPAEPDTPPAFGSDSTHRWTALAHATERLRQAGNRRAEIATLDQFRDAGWPARGSIKPTTKGAPRQLPGEIDVLAADITRRILWVLEVKDLQAAFSPIELSHRVTSIHGSGWAGAAPGSQRRRRDHVRSLEAKADAVASDLSTALSMLALSESVATPNGLEGWRVSAAFVTPTLTPAAFVNPPRALFVLLENVTAALSVVPPGHRGFVWAPDDPQFALLSTLNPRSAE